MRSVSLARRRFLRANVLLLAGATLSACANAQSQLITRGLGETASAQARAQARANPLTQLDVADERMLNRLSFGPNRVDRAFVQMNGRAAWIEQQLDPASIDDDELALRLSPFDIATLNASDIHDLYANLFDEVDSAAAIRDFRQITLLRQIYSQRQLHERMVEFWSDHFNIYIEKGSGWYLKPVDDREVIRQHALGNFRDLLWASAHSPAMLVYLDNQANRAGAPNENYARELMELHTLGVDGGYSQQDVQALARCLTGWRVKESPALWSNEFEFDSSIHDPNPKQLLNMNVAPAGQPEAEQVIEHLAMHPITAQFIATKLVRRFIGDDAPKAVVQRTAAAFLRSRGDIRMTLRAMLLDHDWRATQPKLKRPLQLVTSALRSMDGQTDGGAALQMHLSQMGHAAFGWATPDGYPERGEAWQHQLMPRWQFALALAQEAIPGTQLPLASLNAQLGAQSFEPFADAMARQVFGGLLTDDQRRDLLAAICDTCGAADAPVTEETQLLRLQTLLAALWASPQFQWC